MLSDVLTKAAADLQSYKDSAAVVVQDQTKLATDQGQANDAAETAQVSCQQAITALTSELAGLPAVMPSPPAGS